MCIWHDNCCSSWQAFDIYLSYVSGEARLSSSGSEYNLLKTFEFIKPVSDTVLDMINVVHCVKYLILSGLQFGRSHHPSSSLSLYINIVSLPGFPTERWEAERIFNMYQINSLIDHDDFCQALKDKKTRKSKKPVTVAEQIQAKVI